MNKFLLCSIAMAVLAFPLYAQEDPNSTNTDGTMYVIPVNSKGALPPLTDGEYEGQVAMVKYEGVHGVSAKNVRIDYGFVFEGVSGSDDKRTFYQLANGSVRLDSENSLVIAPDATHYIPVTAGTYDINLYQPSPGTRLFTITPARIVSGIDAVSAAESASTEYFDCYGHRLPARPTSPGLYIARSGAKSSKIVVN